MARIFSIAVFRFSSALFAQYHQYGYWKVPVILKHRKAASWRHLVPALAVCLCALVAVAAAWLQYGHMGLTRFPVLDGWRVVLYSVLGGIVLSVVGAVYPAFSASRMRPVDALRVDE